MVQQNSFTDDELRVLKEMCKNGNFPIEGQSLLPLLARLEAAEKVCEEYVKPEIESDIQSAYVEWRKAAGK
jgi:hypothetical protein